MRKAKVFSETAALPRMSWSPRNLYNLLNRSTNPQKVRQTNHTQTHTTIYHQRATSKRLVRGYHGDHIPETRFKRWFLPIDLPSYSNPAAAGSSQPRPGGIFERMSKLEAKEKTVMPISSLFVREIERRLDTAVFRCCFARSIYEARALVVQGKVKLNGTKMNNPNQLLEPGDLISVEPESIYMLSVEAEKAAKRLSAVQKVVQSDGEVVGVPVQEEADAAGEPASAPNSDQSQTATATSSGSSSSNQGAENSIANAVDGQDTQIAQSKRQPHKPKVKKQAALPEGVRPFHLPPFAAPFLFVPPFLEVSFSTCSAIYLRHPTLTRHRRRLRAPKSSEDSNTNQPRAFETIIQSDVPSPYSPLSDLFSLSWEHYVRNSPRVRSYIRRLKNEAKVGTNGHESARAADEWRKRLARRRGVTKSLGPQGKLVTVEALRRKGVRMRLMKKSKGSLQRCGSNRS